MRVFLSHSTKDKAFVEKLAGLLRAEEIEPWLCEVDLDIGHDLPVEISKGLKECELVVLVWSPEAAASPWTEIEWSAALHREVSESRTVLAVLMLRDCALPEILRSKIFADARTDPEKGLRDIVEWAKRQRAMRGQAAAETTVRLRGREPEGFVGRAQYLDRLHAELVERPGMLLLYGSPGSGKSTLALQFAWQFRSAFEAVVVQTCGQRGVDAIAAELAGQLQVDGRGLAPERVMAACRDRLEGSRSLLVLDDVWNGDLEGLIPGAPASVLFTSRQRRWRWIQPAHALEVVSFSPEEAESVFRGYLQAETVDQHREALLELAGRVGRLPIAVVAAADLLGGQFGPLDQAAREMELDKLRTEVHDVPGLLGEAVGAQREPDRKLLEAMAVCAPEGFWLPLAGEVAGLSEAERDQARDRLINASLARVIDQDRQRFQLHALLRDQLRRSASLAELQERHAAALEGLFRDRERRWRECRECLEEVNPALRFLWERGAADRVGQLSHWGFSVAWRTGELGVALRILKQEESFWAGREDRRAKHSLQRSFGNQALILKAWGRLDEAMTLHKKQEALCLELGEQDSLQIGYGNLAGILAAWGRLDEAMALYKKQEALCLELGNKDSLQLSYGGQALILKDWGRLDEAIALHKREEALCLELGNKDSLQRSHGNQALILQTWGRLDEAMALLKKKEALCLELGNKDSLQRSYGNQALILQTWGRLDEALALHKKEEALCLELGNKDSLQGSYGNQAAILLAWRRLDEAMALLQKQEELCLELGLKRDLGYCYGNWGLLARQQGDGKLGREKLEAALAIFTALGMPRQREEVEAALRKRARKGTRRE